jgi:serine/threonine protein kinase
VPRGRSGENQLTHGIALDFVQGRTLQEELHDFYSKVIDTSETQKARLDFLIRYIGYMKEVLEFLDALHSHQLVAMDLAPPNIMLEDISGRTQKKVVIIDPSGIRSPQRISQMWKWLGKADLILTSPYFPLRDSSDLKIHPGFDYYAMGVMLLEACIMSARSREIYTSFESIEDTTPSLAQIRELISEAVVFENSSLETETKSLLFRFIDSRESRVTTKSEALALLNQWQRSLEMANQAH